MEGRSSWLTTMRLQGMPSRCSAWNSRLDSFSASTVGMVAAGQGKWVRQCMTSRHDHVPALTWAYEAQAH